MNEKAPFSGQSILQELGPEGILDHLKLTWALVRDHRIPLRVRALPAIGIAYVLKGKDLIPDNLPVIGRLDDILALVGSFWLMTQFANPDVVNEHRQRIANDRQRRNAPPPTTSPRQSENSGQNPTPQASESTNQGVVY